MRLWIRVVAGVAVVAIAVAAATAAFAMRGGDGVGDAAQTNSQPRRDAGEGGGSAVSAICVQDAPECDDMIVSPGADFDCPPDVMCSEPGIEPVRCPEDVPVDVCYPDARPIGPYVCAESPEGGAPPLCKPTYCDPLLVAPQQPAPEQKPDASPPPMPDPRAGARPPPVTGNPDEPVASAVNPCLEPAPCLGPAGAPCHECAPEAPCPLPLPCDDAGACRCAEPPTVIEPTLPGAGTDGQASPPYQWCSAPGGEGIID